jgi:hypothetical protein
MAIDDFTDDERVAVVAAVRKALADDPFPRAPRLEALRRALAKLDPTSVRGKADPALQATPCGSDAQPWRPEGEAIDRASGTADPRSLFEW